MFCTITSATLSGVNATLVNVETDLSNGLPCFIMTGVLSAEVKEAGERVKAAIRNSGINIPSCRIIVNVSPAGFRKAGTTLDLPIAVGILADMERLDRQRIGEFLIMGELSLDGRVNSIRGVLAAVETAYLSGIHKCIVPVANLKEAGFIKGMQVFGVETLEDVISVINHTDKGVTEYGRGIINEYMAGKESRIVLDFSDIAGQNAAKRVTMIAAAGHHNLLYVGPPGSGKTMLASRIAGILPSLSEEEALEIFKIYSAAGLMESVKNLNDISCEPPFREVHHSITKAGLLGGGRYPVPGEITLAHNGVLFLDELPLFSMEILESLRIPLEQKLINIIRSGQTITFPADFMLVAAMNPCKCGYYPDMNRCKCTEIEVERYVGRLSKPLLDRFDLSIRVEKPNYSELIGQCASNDIADSKDMYYTTSSMREKVSQAVAVQKKRYAKLKIRFNAQLNTAGIKKFCELDKEGNEIIESLYERWNLSARGYHKILKVARTIADLEGSERIRSCHVSEAVAYRSLDFEEGASHDK